MTNLASSVMEMVTATHWATFEVRQVWDVRSSDLHGFANRGKLARRARKDTKNDTRVYYEYPQEGIIAFATERGWPLTTFGESLMALRKHRAELPPVQQGQVEQFAKAYTGDPEIIAMTAAYEALRHLTEEQKDRALKWLCERLDHELARK